MDTRRVGERRDGDAVKVNEKVHEVSQPPDNNGVALEEEQELQKLHGEGSCHVGGGKFSVRRENVGGDPNASFVDRGPAVGVDVVPPDHVDGVNIKLKKKKPFNLLKDSHPRKPITVSPGSENRPKKRSRMDAEEPRFFTWTTGLVRSDNSSLSSAPMQNTDSNMSGTKEAVGNGDTVEQRETNMGCQGLGMWRKVCKRNWKPQSIWGTDWEF
ncbi:hypothetical protein Hanom_Chr11g01020321 [Helianthus anomalus]